jgi:hypothetical protein
MRFTKLRDFLRRHPLILQAGMSLAVGVPMGFAGSLALRTEVSHGWLSPVIAPCVNWPFITGLLFLLNFYVVWRSRRAGRQEAAGKWFKKSAVHSLINQSLYLGMVVLIGWPYLTVNVSLYALGPMFFLVDNLWVFAEKRRVEMAEMV